MAVGRTAELEAAPGWGMVKAHLQTLRERWWRGGRCTLEWFCFSLCVGVAPITLELLWGREGPVWMQGREQVELHWRRPWPPAQVWGHSDPEPAQGVSWRSQGLSPCGPRCHSEGRCAQAGHSLLWLS